MAGATLGPRTKAAVAEIDLRVRARDPAIWVVTFEEGRLRELLGELAREQGKRLFAWTAARGLYEPGREPHVLPEMPRIATPRDLLLEIRRSQEPASTSSRTSTPTWRTRRCAGSSGMSALTSRAPTRR